MAGRIKKTSRGKGGENPGRNPKKEAGLKEKQNNVLMLSFSNKTTGRRKSNRKNEKLIANPGGFDQFIL